MATRVANLEIGIHGDTTGLEKATKSVGEKLKGLGKIAGLALGAGLIKLSGDAIKAFGEQEKAIAKVTAGLESTEGAAGHTLDALVRQAQELQKTSLFGDEEILSKVTAQLLTFTRVTQTQFPRAQAAIVDLAAKMDGDLQGATIMVGKALNDPIANLSALSRAGIQFTDDQKETIRTMIQMGDEASAQDLILGELEAQYGGTAAAIAAMGTGPMVQLQNAFGDMLEVVGGVIVDALMPLVNTLTDATNWFGELDKNSQTVLATFAIVGTALGALALAFGWIPAAIGAVVAAAILLRENWDTVVFHLESAWLTFKAAFLTAASLLLTGFENFINSSLDVVRPLADFMGVDLPEKISVGGDALNKMAVQAVTDLGSLQTAHANAEAAAEAQKVEAQALFDKIQQQGKPAITGLAADLDDAEAATESLKDATALVPAELDSVISSTDGLTTSLGAAGSAMGADGGVIGKLREMTTDLDLVESATSGVKDKMREWGLTSDTVLNDISRLVTDKVWDSLGRVGEILEQLPGLTRALKTAFDDMVASAITKVGELIAKLIGEGGLKAAMEAAFATSTAGSFLAALTPVGVAIVGIWTALTAVAGIIDGFRPVPGFPEGNDGRGTPSVPGGFELPDVGTGGGSTDTQYPNPFGNRTQVIQFSLDGRTLAETVVQGMPDLIRMNGG